MRRVLIITLLSVLSIVVGAATACAMCRPSDCAVKEIEIVRCEPLAPTLARDLEKTDYGPQVRQRMLADEKSLFLTASVLRELKIPAETCYQSQNRLQTLTNWSDADAKEQKFIYGSASKQNCSSFTQGTKHLLFSTSPCCDTFPPLEPVCFYKIYERLSEVPDRLKTALPIK